MKKLILFILVCCTACVQPPPPLVYHYTGKPKIKADEVQQRLSGDMAYCLAQASAATSTGFPTDFGGRLTALASSMEVRDMCLAGRGWVRS